MYLIVLATGEFHEETLTIPLARGITLPRNSAEGESIFDSGKVRLHFRAEPGVRKLSVNWLSFGGCDLSAEVTMRLPREHESMTIVIPIAGNRFYYNRKVNCMPAEGSVKWGDTRIAIQPANSLGNLDWGRGVWDGFATTRSGCGPARRAFCRMAAQLASIWAMDSATHRRRPRTR